MSSHNFQRHFIVVPDLKTSETHFPQKQSRSSTDAEIARHAIVNAEIAMCKDQQFTFFIPMQ